MELELLSRATFPPCVVVENYNSSLIVVAEGSYGGYSQCNIQQANAAPVATPDMATTPEGQPVSICVLDNDSDSDGQLDSMSLTIVNNPPASQGTISVNATSGCLDFVPAAGFTGQVDMITYSICDQGYSIPAALGDDNPTSPSDPVPTDAVVLVHNSECTTSTLAIEVTGSRISLTPHVFLSGPFVSGTGLMSLNLKTNNRIPLTEPYTAMGWHSGSETTTSSVILNNPVVDWVLLQLRDQASPSTIIETKAGLLLENGNVVDVDGTSALTFLSPAGNYYVAVRHRNHLGIMTNDPIAFMTSGSTSLDFGSIALYGAVNGYTIVGSGQGLWSGDTNGDGSINATDRSNTWNERNQTGYLDSDCNLNGSTEASDRAITWNNRNKSSSLP